MKLALLMMVHAGEAPYLRLHLPVFAKCFDGIMIIFERGQDIETEVEAVRDARSDVEWIVRDFDGDWAKMLNQGIEAVELSGIRYDAVLRLDPDEAMFPEDIIDIRMSLEHDPVLALPRYNFWGDRLHYIDKHPWWPDHQTRAFRLNCGYHYEGQHHEHLVADRVMVDPAPIYHYGWVGKQRILERDFHYLQVAREKEGLPPLAERPADREFPQHEVAEFKGVQPIDPNVVGIYAPYQE